MKNMRITKFKRRNSSKLFTITTSYHPESVYFVKGFGLWKHEDTELKESTEDCKFGYFFTFDKEINKEEFEDLHRQIRDDIFEYTRHNNGAPTLSQDFLIRRLEDAKFQRLSSKYCLFGDENDS